MHQSKKPKVLGVKSRTRSIATEYQDSHSAVKQNNTDFKALTDVVFLKKVQFSIDHLCLQITIKIHTDDFKALIEVVFFEKCILFNGPLCLEITTQNFLRMRALDFQSFVVRLQNNHTNSNPVSYI